MNDLEICKKIAEIENIEFRPLIDSYNPIKNDAICFGLAKKYRVSIDYLEEWQRQQSDKDTFCFIQIASGIHALGTSRVTSEIGSSVNKSICLAIIESQEE